jgi:hypothetical protein
MVLGECERSLLQNQVCSRDGVSLLRQVPSGSPSTSGKKKSVHLAPTLLGERSGRSTVGRGLRAESQRLL